MNRYFIRLSFAGTQYHGWQEQNNSLTVQKVVTDAVSLILRNKIKLTGCGRTDAGVHAEEFYAHFDYEKKLNNESCTKFVHKLNGLLPEDIAVFSVLPVLPEAHARFSALSRTYEYRISKVKNPFLNKFSLYFSSKLDVEKMNRCAEILKEYSDFSCFSRSHTQTKTNLCRIMKAQWVENNDLLVFRITADRFLRNMVRAVVGTMMEIGKGKIDEKQFREILLSKNRSRAGKSVSACGLFLTKVVYPEELFLKNTE